jgi:prepilin-type N-terminal cleavage/methylation domain-containing protein
MRGGFSLIEVLLSVALITVIMGFALPVHQTFQSRIDRNVAANVAAQSMRQAQALSRGMTEDDTWGVALTGGNVVVFKGSSFATRDAAFDEEYTMPATVSASGTTEYVFEKVDGRPQSAGSTTFSGNAGAVTVTVNDLGMIEY